MKKKDKDVKPNGPGDDSQPKAEKGEQKTQPTFLIQRLYTKGVTFDAPNLDTIFGKEWKPQLDINIKSNNKSLSNDVHEVELAVSVNCKLENQAIFNIEVKQVGIFTIQNYAKEQMDPILGSECLKILYPYVREAITDLTSRATLPQLYLTPINFDAIYLQQQAQKKMAS